MQEVEERTCLWCGQVFTPRATGGVAQQYCSIAHGRRLVEAARRWAMRELHEGRVTVGELRGDCCGEFPCVRPHPCEARIARLCGGRE